MPLEPPLEVIAPHDLPNQLRVCYVGKVSTEEAQAKLGDKYRVLEVRPAQCIGVDRVSLVEATEVVFGYAR